MPIVIALYLVAGLVAAWWSFHHGRHREDASTTARVVSSVVVGLVWPAIALDLWLLDSGDTRGRRGKDT